MELFEGDRQGYQLLVNMCRFRPSSPVYLQFFIEGKSVFRRSTDNEHKFMATPENLADDCPFPGVTWHSAPDFRSTLPTKDFDGILPFLPWA